MTPRALLHNIAVCRALLGAASLLIPRSDRREWREEWNGELWHLLDQRGLSHTLHESEEATAFCRGAFADALWMRRNHPARQAAQLHRAGAGSRHTLLLLAVVAAAGLLLCLILPGPHGALSPLPYQRDSNLLAITRGGYAGMQTPTIDPADYHAWQTSMHGLFTEVAFYQPATTRIRIAQHPAATLTVARASESLFELLQLPIDGNTPPRDEPRLLISTRTWEQIFHSDPAIIGQTAFVGGHLARIAGVLPANAWRLPGEIDAWLLESDTALRRHTSGSAGFVLARMRNDAFPADGWRTMTVPRGDDKIETFDCISIAQQTRRPWSTFLFALFLACLALPATTPLPLGSYPPHSERLSPTVRARRWMFLATKLALLVPMVAILSFDLAFAVAPRNAIAALYLQLATAFFGFLFAFRWALRDQRMRCPVCLARLSNPARVGQASCNFLAWHGTELICTQGHGLLHIPDLQTSWFSSQRWLYLDASWRGVFTEVWPAAAGGAP